jgi:hypothetical protein
MPGKLCYRADGFMSEPGMPKRSSSQVHADPDEELTDELAEVSPERLREMARISLASPLIQSPGTGPDAHLLPLPPSHPAQGSGARDARAPLDSDWDAQPTKVIQSPLEDAKHPAPEALPHALFMAEAGSAHERRSQVTDRVDPHPPRPPPLALPRPGPVKRPRQPTLLGVGTLGGPPPPRGEEAKGGDLPPMGPPGPAFTPTPASVASPPAPIGVAVAPPPVAGTADPTVAGGRASTPGLPAPGPVESPAPPPRPGGLGPGSVRSSDVATPLPTSTPRMPPPLEPPPSRAPQRIGRETIPSHRGLTAQPPLALPELMRRPRPRRPSRVALVLAVIVPLTIGVGAGLLFFKKPASVGSGPPPASPGAVAAGPSERAGSSDEVAPGEAASDTPPADPSRASPEERAPEPARSSVLNEVESGEPDAIAALDARPPAERSVAETLALARGRVAARQRTVQAFGERLRARPEVLEDPAELAALRALITDRDTALLALTALADPPTAAGADVLYDVWVGTRGRSETTWLAEQLVFSPEVRQAASRALQVTLALRSTEDCEEVKALLPEAQEHGDVRSLRLLKRLLGKRGCGKNGREDCFACLRPLDRDDEAVSVADALAAAKRRPAPRTR